MKTQKPVLTISLLISNRPDTVPRCLDSLKPIMEAIPSELILIDTSKSEEMRKLLLTYTDKVYEFEWCKDFAKARNEGIKRATGEWFLFLDDDEWFVDPTNLICFFQSGEYKKYGFADYLVRSFTDASWENYGDVWVTRLFQLEKDTRFIGKVHERYYPPRGEKKFLDVIVNHTGYIFETKDAVRAHFERNSEILFKVMEDEPDNLRWKVQLVQEYQTVKEWDAIIELCKKCIDNIKKIDNTEDQRYFCILQSGFVDSYLEKKEYEEAIKICSLILQDSRSTELFKFRVCLRMAQCYAEMNKWDCVAEYIDKYFMAYKKMKNNKALMREEVGALTLQKAFSERNLKMAYNLRICEGLKRGSLDELRMYYDCLEWQKKNIVVNNNLAQALLDMMIEGPYDPLYVRIITDACKNEIFRDGICARANKLEKEDPKAFEKLASIYAKADSDFWYIRYCCVVDADARGDSKVVLKALEELLQSLNNVFYLPDRVYEIIDRYGMKIAELWNKYAGKEWMDQIRVFVNQCEDCYIDKAYDYIVDVYGQDNWRADSLPVALVEKQLCEGLNVRVLDYHNLLCDYAERVLVWYYYFSEEYGTEAIAPKEVRAAVKIKDYAELESVDVKQALACLKEAVVECPDFAKGIGEFFQFYSLMGEQRAKRRREELQEIRSEAMNEIRDLMCRGEYSLALQIMEQLKQMCPGDEEVTALAQELESQMIG